MQTWYPYSPKARRRLRVLSLAVGVFAVVAVVALIVLLGEGRFHWLNAVTTCLLLFWSVMIWRMTKIHTSATEKWVEVSTGFRTRRIPWDDVEEIIEGRFGNVGRLRLSSGEEVELLGVTGAYLAEVEGLRPEPVD